MISPRMLDGGLPGRKLWPRFRSGLELLLVPGASISHPGRIPGPGERKLYLFIEGPNEQSAKKTKSELKRVLEDIMKQTLQSASHPGRHQVL